VDGRLVANELALPRGDRDRLCWAALLHDVGKLEVASGVLNKPGPLDSSEWDRMRRHPLDGARLCAALLPWLGPWGNGIAEHHEKYDGSGYPTGLTGERISYAGRIISVVDAYETMTAARTYKTELITDAFAYLGGSIAAARERVPAEDIGARWLAAASAYREWARSEPQQFALVLGMPVPGYAAPDDGPTSEAAEAAMGELAELFVAAVTAGQLGPPLVADCSPALAECASDKHGELDGIVSPASFQAMLHAWASLHGITSLEAYGHLDWLEPEAREALFLSTVAMAATAAGLPAPR